MGRDAGLLSPGLISPSNCITSVKFRRFTRNYHQHPSAPGLSEQVNDLSPGLCPHVTAITAGLLTAAKSLSPTSKARALYPAIHPQKPCGTMAHPTPRCPCLPPAPEQDPLREGTAAHSPSPPPAGLIAQAWDIWKTPSIPPPPSRQLRLLLGVSEGARGLARFKRAQTLPGCPTSPSIRRRSTRLLPCLQSDFGAERPRRVEMPPGLSVATAKPIRAGIFRRVFQISA